MDPIFDLLTGPRLVPDRTGAAPDSGALAAVLSAAVNVPDHGALRPWRFVVVAGLARQRFSDALVAGLHVERGEDLPASVVTKMGSKAFASPCLVMLISSPVVGSNVPLWEQVASASCTGYAMVLAATSLGLGSVWKSAGVLHTEPVRNLFHLAPGEQLLGWVNLGTAENPDRSRRSTQPVELASLVKVLNGEGEHPFRVDHPV